MLPPVNAIPGVIAIATPRKRLKPMKGEKNEMSGKNSKAAIVKEAKSGVNKKNNKATITGLGPVCSSAKGRRGAVIGSGPVRGGAGVSNWPR